MINSKAFATHWANIAFAFICMAAVGTAAHLMGLNPQPLNDELYDMARPAAQYIQGFISPQVKYPSFSFYFFGIFIKLSGTLNDMPAAVQVSRWVNLGLFAVNLTLFFWFAQSIFSRAWALVATLVFLGFPWLWVSAIVVKTESLQLFAVLLTLVAVSRINVGGGLRWHGLAALGAALALSTKLTGFALVLYLINLAYARKRNLLTNPIGHAAATFAAVFTVTLLATFTNLWIFPEILNQNAINPYLSAGPAPLTAVSEWSNLMYGRLGSFFAISLPLLAGFYGALWVGSVSTKRNTWLNVVFGLSTIISLAVVLVATRHRVPYAFAGYCLYLFVASAQFIRTAAIDGLVRRRFINWTIVAALIAIVVFQIAYSVWWAPQWVAGIARANEVSRQINETDQGEILYVMEGNPADGEDYAANLDATHPRFLFVLNQYVENFCKYRTTPVYVSNCTTFRRLIQEEGAYRVVERIPLPLPFDFLSPDPELRDPAVYLLELNSSFN